MPSLRALLPFCLLMPGLASADTISVACANELTRRDAIAASDYAEKHPSWLYWVGVDGKTLGPWTIFDIKRQMTRGQLPTELYFFSINAPAGWQLSSQAQEFVPLPTLSALAPQEIAAALPGVVTGCWVSDPVSEAGGEETTWVFLLFDSGVFFPSRGTLKSATGDEGFWFSRSSTEHWSIAAQNGAAFTLTLPDINFLEPQDAFPARLVDRNTMQIDLPGLPGLTFRRM